MTSRTASVWGRAAAWAAATALAMAALATPLAAAAAEPGGSVYIGGAQGPAGGFHPVWGSTPADPAHPGQPDLWAYCIEHNVTANTHIVGQVGELSSFVGENYFTDPAVQSRVIWVLAHAFPANTVADLATAAGAPALTRDDAIEATQYAIWRYTDLTFDAPWRWSTPASEALYWYLVNGANADAGSVPPAGPVVTVSVTGPTVPQTAGELIGPFVVHTDQATATVSVDPAIGIVDAAGAPLDPTAVPDGAEIFLDLRGSSAAGAATVTATAHGASGTGMVVSVPKVPGGTPTTASHAQSLILVAADDATTTSVATVEWAAPAVPTIGTTLVDAADQDHVLPWNGGTVVDTIVYRNLTPGVSYTVSGELMRKSDGTATGITGATTFTPTAPDGTVTVTFAVPSGFAGTSLVAFEELRTDGALVAEHKDLQDAAQTVAVEAVPVTSPAVAGTGGAAAKGQLAATGSEVPVMIIGLGVLAILAGAAGFSRRRA